MCLIRNKECKASCSMTSEQCLHSKIQSVKNTALPAMKEGLVLKQTEQIHHQNNRLTSHE